VFHTSFRLEGDPYLEEVRRTVGAPRAYFSTEPVPANEVDSLVSSADVGVALYSVKELGFRAEFMGLASGKIANYLKCGLPVVASDIPSIRRYVESYRCGVCVQSADQVKDAIAMIMSDYRSYSENAVRCFNELWAPDRYCASIAERLDRLCRHGAAPPRD
jgi:glycosyltransferase involved in cell wall biosynthesis